MAGDRRGAGVTVVREAFKDPIHADRAVVLVVDSKKPLFEALKVEHPDCDQLADVSLDLDAYFCTGCQWNGRISGAWAFDEWTGAIENEVSSDLLRSERR